ncbi:MAG: aldehyde dehydrogenase family protein [Acidobacteriota bacterium]
MSAEATKPPVKITYATMSGDQLEELHKSLDAEVERVRSRFGQTHPMWINGRQVTTAETFRDTSPIDTRTLLGHFAKGTQGHVKDAINAARAAFPSWSRTPWQQRVRLLRKVADLIRDHRSELSVLMGFEAGKTRLECLGDVEESADLIAYYCDQMEENGGFEKPMNTLGPDEDNVSLLRPYGVWAVISPFNFPLALAAGPAGGALVAGNTVVFKPASDTPYMGLRLAEIVHEAGLPHGVFNFVTGGGGTVGQELIENHGVDGIVFTGSRDIGFQLVRNDANRPIPRPLVIETGGKNPAIVMPSADLDKAADGVYRSAFGNQGQKCSACSRTYIHRNVRKAFVEALVEKTRAITIGDPLDRNVYMGPVINQGAVDTYLRAIDRARRDGGRILVGGRRMAGAPYEHGYFVEPTIIDGLPKDHPLFFEELFVPLLVLTDVHDLDEAIDWSNRSEYGLTAGIFSEDVTEVDRFFDEIHAGVTYANRRAGATTGAWPGINPFVGWKASGLSGRGTGGPYYVQQFMREQSRVRMR